MNIIFHQKKYYIVFMMILAIGTINIVVSNHRLVAAAKVQTKSEDIKILDIPKLVTGYRKIAATALSNEIKEYTLSYYNACFLEDKKNNDIIYFTNLTITKISITGSRLDITVYEYAARKGTLPSCYLNGI